MRTYLLLLVILLSLYSCTGKADQPDIILISVDDMGWSDLGCYGSEIHTPTIDRLAGEGMRFTSFHNTSKCFPSRACLITGVYAQQSGYASSFNGPLQNAVTLGEVLREAGYITLWSGKHHGLENPYFRGFDHYYGLKDGACNHFNPGEQRPGEAMPARKEDSGIKRNRAWCMDSLMYRPYTPEEKDFYTTDYFTKAAINWIESYADDHSPLFLYMAYTAPHDPLMAWPEDILKYEGAYDEGYEAIRAKRYRKQMESGLLDESFALSPATHPAWEDLSDSLKQKEARKMEVYAAMIDRLDQNIALLLKALEESGRLENTLILFVSDNGASAEMVNLGDDFGEIGSMSRWTSLGPAWANVANTPFRYFKNYSHEGGINTPLIAWWPGHINKQSFSSFPGHFIDIMPTLAEVAAADYPQVFGGVKITPMQGVSLLPAFLEESEIRHDPLFWEWRDGQAVRDGDWKLVRHGMESPWELYNVKEDPTETRDRAGALPAKLSELEELFLNWKKEVNAN